mgnify:CR=1 FL=1
MSEISQDQKWTDVIGPQRGWLDWRLGDPLELPLYPELTLTQQDEVITAVKEFESK